MCAKWLEIIESSSDQKAVFNIPAWLSRGTLDAIGQGSSLLPLDKNGPSNFPLAAFDVQFGTIQNDGHLLARKYDNIMSVLLADLLFGLHVTLCCSKERRFWPSLCATDFHTDSFQVFFSMGPRVGD